VGSVDHAVAIPSFAGEHSEAPIANLSCVRASAERSEPRVRRLQITTSGMQGGVAVSAASLHLQSAQLKQSANVRRDVAFAHRSPTVLRHQTGSRRTARPQHLVTRADDASAASRRILVALLLFATNVRKIDSFLLHAEPDADGTPRKRRVRRRTTKPIQDWRAPIAAASGAPRGSPRRSR
jgi:hypothetical protein